MNFKLSDERIDELKRFLTKRWIWHSSILSILLVLLGSLLSILSKTEKIYWVFILGLIIFIWTTHGLLIFYLYRFIKKNSEFEITDEGIRKRNKIYKWPDLKKWRILGFYHGIFYAGGFDFVDQYYYLIRFFSFKTYPLVGIRIYFGNPFYDPRTLFYYLDLTVSEEDANNLIPLLKQNIGDEINYSTQIIAGLTLRRFLRGLIYFIFYLILIPFIIYAVFLLAK